MRGRDRREEKAEFTPGDLLIAINDAAFEAVPDSPLSYLLAEIALEKILKRAAKKESSTPREKGMTLH